MEETEKKKVLFLVLKRKPFEVMAEGEKNAEYRKPTKWILDRLQDKDGKKREYDFIVFQQGYRVGAPRIACRYLGWEYETEEQEHRYSNGLRVKTTPGDIIIKFTLVGSTMLRRLGEGWEDAGREG